MAVLNKDVMGIKDIADFCGKSPSVISNWRKRDDKDKFPLPFQDTSVPLWRTEDIMNYLRDKFGYDVIATGNLSRKRIAIVGRPRVGKSYIIGLLVQDREGFWKLFTSNSDDKTVCPVYVKISDYFSKEEYVFHSDFSSVYKPEDAEKSDLVKQTKEAVAALVDKGFQQDDLDSMRQIETVVRDIRKVEEAYPGRRATNTYIDTFQRPSEFTTKVLREFGLGCLEVIDTPGVAGSVVAAHVAKSDLYLFVLKSDNKEEAQTIRRIVDEIKADVAVSKVGFLYKSQDVIFTQEDYIEAGEAASKDMRVYNDLFEDLKGSIISTDLDVCDPAAHCIVFPPMSKKTKTLPEEMFLAAIENKMSEAFNESKESREGFKHVMQEHGFEAKRLVLKLLKGIPKYELGAGETVYTTDNLLAENHGRVMTGDNYRLRSDLDDAYELESKKLDSYFSSYMPEDYSVEWQQIIIKYLYRTLIMSIRNDRGLGIGTHPWEEYPPRTMLVEESILADKVLDALTGVDSKQRNQPYRKTLQDNNIHTASPNFVGCKDDTESERKLNIIRDCLLDVQVSNRKEMVLCRYIGGLRKEAEFEILLDMGYSESEAMAETKSLPF